MRYKKHMIILLAAIFLFAMATASAADSNDTAVAVEDRQLTDEIIQASENQENTIQASYNDEVNLSEDDSGKLAIGNDKKLGKTVTGHNFADINREIESDCTIYLEPGTYNGGSQILIDGKSNIKIIGDSTILDAQCQTGIFRIFQSSNITIQNIIFKNGNHDFGGAIDVYNSCYDCSISNCTFINNTAKFNGGAISWFTWCANGRVSNCTFINNTAKQYGGAINWYDSNDGRVNNCTFINNTADWNGDAIYAMSCDLNADYNWFGNTATNYNDQLPINSYVKCDYRLFLKATANPDTITGKDTSNITFKLYQYHSDVTSDYDNAPFKNLDLTITATNGNVKGTAKLGEPIQFTPTRGGTASVTATVENVRQTVEINVKGDFDLLQDLVNNESLSVINLERNYTYNEFDTIRDGVRINRPITINGNGFTIDAKGKSRIFWVTAGSINITDVTLKNGKAYTGGAIYFGNDIYNSNINATYINNTAEWDGGANFFLGSVSGSNITGIYAYNTATSNGGANYFDYSVSGSNIAGTYINNTASRGVIIYFMVYSSAILTNVTIENAIFLNNKYDENMGIIHAEKTGLVAKNNWFGNNATNYNTQPKTTGIQMDSWLFLNATADPNPISVFDSSDILFKLYSTNGTHISGYDNSKLPVVNLTLTAINGEVSNSTILDKSVEYMPTKGGQGSVTASVEDAEYTIFLDNNKRDVNLSVAVDPPVIDYGENAAVILEYNATATGTVNITLKGKKHNQTIENVALNKTITLPDTILPDEYEVTVSYSGDDVFVNASAASSLTLNQLKSDIKVVGYDIYVNDTTGLMFSVTLPENATGNLTISNGIILNVTKEGRKENSSLIIEIMNDAYSVGQYNWTFTYSGDDIYENSQAKSTANILIIPTEITANATSSLFVDDTGQVTYNVTPENAVGNVKFTSNDTSVVEVDQNGNIKAIAEGTAIITVTFEGCENYTASSTNVTVTVSKIATEITLTNGTVELKAYKSIGDLAKLDPAGAGNLTYASSDEDIVVVSEDGIIYARVKGTATVTVSFAGDNKYKAAESKNITVTVTLNDASVSTENDTIDLYVDDACIINATANPSFLTVYYASSNESVATVTDYGNVKAVGEGTAVITLTVGNGETYAVNSTNVTVTVSKVPTEISIENYTLKLEVTDEVDTGATLTPADAGNVTYTISNSSVVKVKDGKVIALAEGEAAITVSFVGDVKYAVAENRTITVTVSLKDASVSVNNDTLDLFVDDTFNLVATTEPKDLTVNFTSSNPSIVTVDNKGNVVAVGEGIANITVSVGGDGVYTENSTTVTVTVSKIPTEIIIQNVTVDMKVDDIFDPVVSLMPSNAGNMSFRSSDIDVVLINGHGMIKAVGEGNATVTVAFPGNEKYTAVSRNITVSVSKIPTEITLTNETLDLKVNDMVDGLANLTPADAGNLTFISSDEDIVFVADGMILAYGKGTATVTVSFAGNDKYAAAENKTITVNVSLRDASVSVENSTLDLKVDDRFDLNATTVPDWLNVEYVSSDESVATVTDYGIVTAVGEGTATITVTVGDNLMFAVNSTNVTVTVKKQDANANVSIPENITVGDNSTVNVVLPEDATGNVTVKVDGEVVDTVPITDGSADVTIPSLSAGNHTVEIAYSGDDKYNPVNQTKEITVSKQQTTLDITVPSDITVGDDSNIEIKLPSDAGGNITVKVDGEVVGVVPVKDGFANVSLSSLKAGNHTVEISYSGDDKYNPVSETKDVSVSKQDATPEIAVDDSNVNVKLPDDATGDVTVKVDDAVVSTAEVTNGTASVKLPELNAGNHTVEIAYSGDDKYKSTSITATITVNKDSTNITAADVTATYKVNKYLVIKLTDSKGNPLANAPVTVELSTAKNYTTDKNGQVKVKVSSLVPKTYTAKITFKGDDNYIGSNTTAKVTVKKATAKITAKAKTFKTTTKTKKYTVTLKANGKALKNKWVYLKVNGKTYKAKTNSKGKATFKITQLNKAGKFKATVTFKGNDYYKKATKKATIKVKSVWKTVQKGSKNSAIVKKIQRALKNHGYYLEYNGRYLMVDGIFWDYTEMAVKEFQKDKTLKVTGKVDEKTAKKLGII